MDPGPLVFWVGALLAAGIVASLLAGRLRLPGLVLVLVLGMAIGSDGTGWIDFGDFELAQAAGGRRARADPLRGRPVAAAGPRSGR